MRVISNLIGHFSLSNKPFILTGDFNHPNIDWINSIYANASDKVLLDLCADLSLSQLITEATHKDGNTLDLLFCNLPGESTLLSYEVDCPITSSCHQNSLSFTLFDAVLR